MKTKNRTKKSQPFCIIALIGLILTISACSNSQSGASESVVPSEPQNTESTTTISSVDNTDSEPIEIIVGEEIINADLYSGAVQIGNVFLTAPSKYSDFASAGATLTSKDYTEEYLMDADAEIIADMVFEGTTFQLWLKNESGELCAL